MRQDHKSNIKGNKSYYFTKTVFGWIDVFSRNVYSEILAYEFTGITPALQMQRSGVRGILVSCNAVTPEWNMIYTNPANFPYAIPGSTSGITLPFRDVLKFF